MTKREQLIKAAYDYLSSEPNRLVEGGVISKTKKGYIASLGGSITQAGLLQSIIFFEATKEGRDEIIKAVFSIMKKQNSGAYGTYPSEKFGDHLINHPWDRRKVTNDFVEAAVALKMAMRLFPNQ